MRSCDGILKRNNQKQHSSTTSPPLPSPLPSHPAPEDNLALADMKLQVVDSIVPMKPSHNPQPNYFNRSLSSETWASGIQSKPAAQSRKEVRHTEAHRGTSGSTIVVENCDSRPIRSRESANRAPASHAYCVSAPPSTDITPMLAGLNFD